jgi:hypothetical protein
VYPATHPATAPKFIVQIKFQAISKDTPKPVNIKGLLTFPLSFYLLAKHTKQQLAELFLYPFYFPIIKNCLE